MTKKLLTVLTLSIALILMLLMTGCGDESVITEADVITIRPYTKTLESGVFTVKHKYYDYIEYTFEYDGEIIMDTIYTSNIEIGDETKAIIEEDSGWVFYDLQLSLEEYKELYGLEERK